jgi:hypothetical protein
VIAEVGDGGLVWGRVVFKGGAEVCGGAGGSTMRDFSVVFI